MQHTWNNSWCQGWLLLHSAPGMIALAGCDVSSHSQWCMRLCLGQKRAREMWFLARMYDAQQALQMGLVNTVVPLDQLETETLVWYVVLLAAVTVLPLVGLLLQGWSVVCGGFMSSC